MNLESLIVPLILDTSKYTGELSKAEASTNSFSQAGEKLSGLGTKLTTGLTLPIVGALTGMVVATSDWTDTVDSLGDVLGTSADESAALAVAIQTVGGNTDTITGQMAKLVNGLVDSSGNLGKNAGLMKELGISFQDANGILLPSTEILTNVADKLAAMPDGLEKTQIMTQLFGKSGKDLSDTMNALANGGLEAAKIKASELGLTMGDDGVNKTIEMDKAMATLKLGTQGLAVTLGTTLIPMITQVVTWLVEGLKWFNSLSPSIKTTIVVVAGLVAGIGPLVTIVGTLSTVIGAVIPVITAVVAVISGPLLLIIAAVIGAIALLALAWKNDWGGIQEKTSAVIGWIEPKFRWFINQLSLIFSAFSLAFKGDWEGFGETLRTVWDNAWEAIKTAFTNAGDAIKTAIPILISNIISFFTQTDWAQIGDNIVQGIAKGITNATQWILKAVQGLSSAAIKAIKGFLGISSPSKVFMGLGLQVGEGFALGISKSSIPVQMASMNMANAAANSTTNNWNLTVNTNGDANVIEQFAVMRALAGGI